jgi:hypothetical protein
MALNPLNRKLDKNGNPIVSKAELEDFKSKYGQNMELRDFLNKERGLTRRGSAGTKASAPVSEERSSTADGPATATAKEVASLMPSPAKPADRSREVTARELAENFNPTPASDRKMPARIRAASASDTSEFMPGGMKKGGKVSSASSRADGCATKGKTKGRFV